MYRRSRIIAAGAVLMLFTGAALAAPYIELTPKFDRKKSRSMVRRVTKPTLACLDYAAYTANPVLFDPRLPKPKVTKKVSMVELTFNNLLSQPCDSLSQTPLTAQEKENPMAWKPLVERLWKVVKDPKFVEIGGKIAGEKWGDPNVARAFQEIACAYIHEIEGRPHLWVKVEFQPFVKFLRDVTDENKDGFPEIYAELSLAGIDEGVVQKAFEWMKNDYLAREQSREEAIDWITILAAYWYPAYNTDVMDLAGDTVWPNAGADKGAIKCLKRLTVTNPLAVIKGNPYGKIIYNVYLVEGLQQIPVEQPTENATAAPKTAKFMDTQVSNNFKDNYDRLKQELGPYQTYEAWVKKVAPSIQAEKDFIAKLPEGQMGFPGKDDWLFFRKSLEMMSGGDLSVQAKEKNPIPNLAEFRKWCSDQDVNMIFVPVPNKEDVYYEKLPFDMPKDASAIVNPYFRKFIKDVQDAGIEVIDLLPLFLKAKQEDKYHKEQLYQHHDTHWTNRGLQIAAKAIADRIKEYSWYKDAIKDSVAFALVDTTFMRLGDIVDKLPEASRGAYPEVQLEASQIHMPDGKPINPVNKNAPLMLIGDSFTGVFEHIDCKSAGVGSNIAYQTRLPIDVITSWGGGPLVREKVLSGRKNDMGVKRVVIYLMVARDLYNYSQNWTPMKTQ